MEFEQEFIEANKYRNVQWPPESMMSLLSKISYLITSLDEKLKEMHTVYKD